MIAATLAATACALAMPTNEEVEKAGAEVQTMLQKQLESWLKGNRSDSELARVLLVMADKEQDETKRYVCLQAALAAFARAGDADSAIKTIDRMRAEIKGFTAEIEKTVVEKAVATASATVAAKIREGSAADGAARRAKDLENLRERAKKANLAEKMRLMRILNLMEKQPTCTLADAEAEYNLMMIKKEAYDKGYEKALSDVESAKLEESAAVAKQAADKVCAANRELIENALSKWQQDNQDDKKGRHLPKVSDLVGPGKPLKHMPRCLRGGTYRITPSGVVCTHMLTEHQEECIAQIKQIESACEQWAIVTKKKGPPEMSDLVGRDKYLRNEPKCPDGGTYRISKSASGEFVVTCSHGDDAEFPHKLPRKK